MREKQKQSLFASKVTQVCVFLYVIFMISCSKDDKVIENTAESISVEQPEFTTYSGDEIKFKITFNDYHMNGAADTLIFKIDGTALNACMGGSPQITEPSLLRGIWDVSIKLPRSNYLGPKQIKVCDGRGKIISDGPQVNFVKAYQLAIVCDIYKNSPGVYPGLLGYRWSVSARYHGICRFDDNSVMVRNNLLGDELLSEVKFAKFSFDKFTPESESTFTYNIELYKRRQTNMMNFIHSGLFNFSTQLGMFHVNPSTDFYVGRVNVDVLKEAFFRICVSTGNESFIPYSSLVQHFGYLKIIQDIKVSSTECVYALQEKSCCVKGIIGVGNIQFTIGSETEKGYKDGDFSTVLFDTIKGIAIDAADNLYVAEAQRVRKITPDRNVTTILDNGLIDVQGIFAMNDGRVYLFDDDKIKILNKEHTQLTEYYIRNKLNAFNNRLPVLKGPICVTENGIVYLFRDVSDGAGERNIACLIPEELVPDKVLEQYPSGLFIRPKDPDNILLPYYVE